MKKFIILILLFAASMSAQVKRDITNFSQGQLPDSLLWQSDLFDSQGRFYAKDNRYYSNELNWQNSTFSDTTTYGDWELIGNGSIDASNDSTLLAYLPSGNVQLPLASVNGQNYRATMQMKEGEDNLVANSGFDKDTVWVKYNSTISGGTANFASAPSGSYVRQAILTSGKTYMFVYDIVSITEGAVKVTAFGVQGTPRTTTGTYSEVLTANGTSVYFQASGTTTASIDNAKVYELDGATQSIYTQPTISYGDKSLTYTALSDDWQNYAFDFTGDITADTLKISLSDTAKIKIDNVKVQKIAVDTVFRVNTNGTGFHLYNLGIGTDAPESRLHIKNSGIITTESGITLENVSETEKFQIMLGSDLGGSASGLTIYDSNNLESLTEFNWGATATDQSYITLYSPDGTKFYITVENDSTWNVSKVKP